MPEPWGKNTLLDFLVEFSPYPCSLFSDPGCVRVGSSFFHSRFIYSYAVFKSIPVVPHSLAMIKHIRNGTISNMYKVVLGSQVAIAKVAEGKHLKCLDHETWVYSKIEGMPFQLYAPTFYGYYRSEELGVLLIQHYGIPMTELDEIQRWENMLVMLPPING